MKGIRTRLILGCCSRLKKRAAWETQS